MPSGARWRPIRRKVTAGQWSEVDTERKAATDGDDPEEHEHDGQPRRNPRRDGLGVPVAKALSTFAFGVGSRVERLADGVGSSVVHENGEGTRSAAGQ